MLTNVLISYNFNMLLSYANFISTTLGSAILIQFGQKFEGLLAGCYLYPDLLSPIFDWLILL
jgi:hypothetical protein